MRSIFYVVTSLIVMGMAFWAYRQNYETQDAMREAAMVREEIATLRETLGVLRAEWAYLNRPDRLRELADLNFDRLGLLPLTPDQFGSAEQVAYPPDPMIVITNPVDTLGRMEQFP
jgi:hypothetical protein